MKCAKLIEVIKRNEINLKIMWCRKVWFINRKYDQEQFLANLFIWHILF